MTTKKTRYCFNNWIDASTYSTSAADPAFPSSNLLGEIRSKVWQARGSYELTSLNNKVRISGTTYTITPGVYSQASLITAFNAATGETLQKDGFGRWQIVTGGSETLELSFATDPLLPELGFLSTTDETGTTFTADERRYNNGEWIKVDLGITQSPSFAALIGPANQVFSAPEASITLQGNNVDSWASPSVSVAMTVSDAGAFAAPNDLPACRYWRILIEDPKNSAIQVSKAYIGTSVVTEKTNFQTGFSRNREDLSIRLISEGGQAWVDKRPKVLSIQNAGVQFLKGSDLREVEQLVYDLGNAGNFFICIDPALEVSETIDQMTHYVHVDGPVSFQHVINSYYNLSFQLREVL